MKKSNIKILFIILISFIFLGVVSAEEQPPAPACPPQPGGSYKIVFFTNNETELPDITVTMGSVETPRKKIPEPTSQGKDIFRGWYYDADLTERVETEYIDELPTPDFNEECERFPLFLFASWEPDIGPPIIAYPKYVVGLYDGSTSSYRTVEYIEKRDTISPTLPILQSSDPNKVFDGWYYDADGNNKVTVSNINELDLNFARESTATEQDGYGVIEYIIYNFDLYASWNISRPETDPNSDPEDPEQVCNQPKGVPPKVRFHTNGGNEIADISIDIVNRVEHDVPVPIRNGYSFLGWYYDENFTRKAEGNYVNDFDFVNEAHDEGNCTGLRVIDVYAKWSKNTGDKDQSQKNPNTGAFIKTTFVIGLVGIGLGLLITRKKFNKIRHI